MPVIEGVCIEGQDEIVKEPSDAVIDGDAAFEVPKIFVHALWSKRRVEVHVM